MKRPLSFLAGILACLTGCSNVKIEDYANNKPVMDIREFFNGTIEASGIFIDYSGKADSYFHIAMKGSWQGEEGSLYEKFIYDDKHICDRTWSIRVTNDHDIVASAHDIVGEAVGKQYGNAVNLNYVMRVPSKDKTYNLSMDDWMFRVDEHKVINRIIMRKFGIKVGEIIVTFYKK